MEMKVAAAKALADVVSDSELDENHIITNEFDERVLLTIVKAVKDNA